MDPGGNSAQLSTVLVDDRDPPGSYRWSITFIASGSLPVTRSFIVSYGAPSLEEPVVIRPVQDSGNIVSPPPTLTSDVTIQPSGDPIRVTIYNQIKGQIEVNIDGTTRTLISYSNANSNGLEGYTSDGLDRQCVELIQRYAGMFTGDDRITGLGDGKYVASNLPDATDGAFAYFANGSKSAPEVGSVISINLQGALAEYGHVGIAQSVSVQGDTITVTLFDQNWPTNSLMAWKTVTFTRQADGGWSGVMKQTTASGEVISNAVAGWANPS